MNSTLSERLKEYESCYDYKITRRVPLAIRVDGKNFSRVTRKLKKPFDLDFLHVMVETMNYILSDLYGAVFGYQQSDEMTFILKNDQSNDSEPYFGNRVQKIVSVVASLATTGFYKSLKNLDYNLDLVGDVCFDTRIFSLPNITECVNLLIWRQQDCIRNSINGAAQTLLTQKLGKKTAINFLLKKTSKEKIELLQSECGIIFEEEFPSFYRLGVGAYKFPVIVSSKDGQDTIRKKWTTNWDLPKFSDKKDFIHNILYSGHDIIRIDNIVPDIQLIK